MPLHFNHGFTQAFPADSRNDRDSRSVVGALYAFIAPEPLQAPQALLWSEETAALVHLPNAMAREQSWVPVLSGNAVAEGSRPYATVYGGHQFGHWAGQLGDGRAINLGEIEGYTLQLKGAGRTPFSRRSDGRAVLRSSIREFLCSEAMHHLGIPTTRALSLIASRSTVLRDMFYDGHPQAEPCAVVCRVSQSFLRFGHFELQAAREDYGLLKQLADYALAQHFPEIDGNRPDAVARMFDEICRQTATLMAHWMSVGFVHGVMNTDNMSLLSETIDYGPYGWLEKYDPQWTPNTTDAEGRRYSYGNQPAVAQWNLSRLGNALYPLINDVEPLQASLNAYNRDFHGHWQRLLAAKLGLPFEVLASQPEFAPALLQMLEALAMDFNLFFDALTRIAIQQEDVTTPESTAAILACSYSESPDVTVLQDWLKHYQALIAGNPNSERELAMRAANPVFILRNHLVQDVIEAAENDDYLPLQQIFARLKAPYADADDDARWVKKCPPESMHRAGCSMLSCSS